MGPRAFTTWGTLFTKLNAKGPGKHTSRGSQDLKVGSLTFQLHYLPKTSASLGRVLLKSRGLDNGQPLKDLKQEK